MTKRSDRPTVRSTIRWIVALSCAGFMAAAPAAGRLPPLPQLADEAYRLDTGDTLDIRMDTVEGMTGTYVVNDQGVISTPILGTVDVRALTIAEVEALLEARLSEGFVLDPEVTVQIATARPFFILGEVARPGEYPYRQNMTVLTAVAVGGGFTFRGNEKAVVVTRVVDGKPKQFRAKPIDRILPGDTVYVRERVF